MAVDPAEAIEAHRAFIARRRALRPSEEYRTPTSDEWDAFLAHFEIRDHLNVRGVATAGEAVRDSGGPRRCADVGPTAVPVVLSRPRPKGIPGPQELEATLPSWTMTLGSAHSATRASWVAVTAVVVCRAVTLPGRMRT